MVATTDRGTAQIHLEVDGQAASDTLMRDLVGASIESATRVPDLAVLRFHDLGLRHSKERVFSLGKKIRVEFGDSESRKEVFIGEVTSVELDLVDSGVTTLVVTALDRTHRLHRGRQTRVFKQVTDSDMAEQIARDLSLHAEVDSTRAVHAYVLQDNQTNWEFLTQRASGVGFDVVVYDQTLYFKAPPARPCDDVEFAWQGDLVSLTARTTAFEQVDDVEVRSWDALNKQAIVGSADRPNLLMSTGDDRPGGEVAHDAYQNEAHLRITSESARSESEADRIAQSALDDVSNAFFTVEGSAVGNPALRAGCGIVLRGVGPQFSGRYVATAVRHSYDSRGYRVHFRATGYRADDLLSAFETGHRCNLRMFPGVVTDNRDDRDAGRVKVKMPLLGDDVESDWCRVVAPGVGKERGVQFLPEIDDEVLVVGSSVGQLYVIGGMWSTTDRPPLSVDDALSGRQTRKRVIRSRVGHRIEIDDEDGGGGITVTTSDGQTEILLDAGGKTVEINADTIKLHARNELSLVSDGEAKLQAHSSASVEAQAQLTLKAAQIDARS